MIGSLWGFLKRHKKKFIVLSSVTGGGWLLYKYMWKKIQEIKEEEDKQYLILLRRQHHFDSNQRTCNMTVLAMVPNIRDVMLKTLDTDSIKEMLKSNPSNKLDLWEELKVMSFTRSLAAVYGTCVLSVMLRVQLNVMGGYLYLDTLNPTNGLKSDIVPSPQIPQRVQERYLSLVKQFIEQGFHDFINYLRSAVTKEIGVLPLKEMVTLDQLSSVFHHIRERVECGVDKATKSLYPYLLTSEQVPDVAKTSVQSDEDQLLEKLISETRDIFESNDFHTVLKDSIDRGYHCILDGVADHFKHLPAVSEQNAGIHTISIALAKLIPVINSLMNKIVGDTPNAFVQELLLMEELKQLAANIYEAFSQNDIEKPSI